MFFVYRYKHNLCFLTAFYYCGRRRKDGETSGGGHFPMAYFSISETCHFSHHADPESILDMKEAETRFQK